ncbi:hypothetical protein HOK51_07340 [Candidatus Woesearchaeota archaeon]|jgi:hypothetical protein|nr:hypothetical protein [Candidatus Woesearchaeota archaeon]MBT7367551.1 hypothetical protein [Candidatus Woesearchaeota archaeon]
MVTFQNVIARLEYMGLSDVLLPFLLIFTVVFAIMQKTQPLGEKKSYNVLIALVLALSTVVPHVLGYYPANADVVVIINKSLPSVSIVLVAIVMVFLVVGLFGGKATWGGALSGWIAFAAFILVFVIFASAANWFTYWPSWLWWLSDPDTQALLIVVGVFALIIWFITKEPGDGKAGESVGKVGDQFAKLFGGN